MLQVFTFIGALLSTLSILTAAAKDWQSCFDNDEQGCSASGASLIQNRPVARTLPDDLVKGFEEEFETGVENLSEGIVPKEDAVVAAHAVEHMLGDEHLQDMIHEAGDSVKKCAEHGLGINKSSGSIAAFRKCTQNINTLKMLNFFVDDHPSLLALKSVGLRMAQEQIAEQGLNSDVVSLLEGHANASTTSSGPCVGLGITVCASVASGAGLTACAGAGQVEGPQNWGKEHHEEVGRRRSRHSTAGQTYWSSSISYGVGVGDEVAAVLDITWRRNCGDFESWAIGADTLHVLRLAGETNEIYKLLSQLAKGSKVQPGWSPAFGYGTTWSDPKGYCPDAISSNKYGGEATGGFVTIGVGYGMLAEVGSGVGSCEYADIYPWGT